MTSHDEKPSVRWVALTTLEMFGFSELLKQVKTEELFNDEFASSIEKLRNDQEKLFFSTMITQNTLLLLLLLGIIPLSSSINLFGITVVPGGRLREILIAIISTMTFYMAGIHTSISSMSTFLWQYALHKGFDDTTRATLLMRYLPLRIRAPLPYSFIQKEVVPTRFTRIFLRTHSSIIGSVLLIVPMVINVLFVVALVDVWTSPAFSRWISYPLVIYGALATLSGIGAWLLAVVPLPFQFVRKERRLQ
jgi:hypothetical protein